ncbi:NAD(P)/FAD-dependent oxidoreductase [Chitinasiproducens palmae]|uniref:Ferredoxin--NADP reductase n=1 Tax=Chitinasiproducens palmae TaxID=1770053 RepID=A0A1H2PQM8_9BURK|nr:NAD(P)/FAD-dependent oxidoreductase [Chitinasiproducens palmae]SDV49130.1 thioredoxin reductase (NADPH) [Chitinasiproducens palmae]
MQDDVFPQQAEQTADVLIIGAGPVGLFAAFQAQVLGLSCRILDTLSVPGGQCIELYPDKPIFDIPAVPVCTGRELVERLVEQIAPFDVPMHLGDEVVALQDARGTTSEDANGGALAADEAGAAPRWRVTTASGASFVAPAVLVAAGGGAFVPQRLNVPGAEALHGSHLHYSVRRLADFAGANVVVAGGGDSALDWALALRGTAANVTLVHRRAAFRAAPETIRRLEAARAAGEIAFALGTVSALDAPDGRLRAVTISGPEQPSQVAADHVIALFGLVAQLGAIGDWGLKVEASRLVVDCHHYETSLAGIFAAGDIAGYPNKQKLILSGFHEASLALRRAYRYIHPERARTAVHSSNDRRLSEAILGQDGSA